ncbi:MAG: LysR substrate-binding domain-containing protein [Pseudomonadota bacterium]
MFTLRQMTYFDALARTGHFRRAAEAVHISQPALSNQIAEMERRAGGPLAERNRNGIVLTDLGLRLLPVMRQVLETASRMEDMAAGADGLLSSRLRIGMIPTIAPYLLPATLASLAQRYPGLDVKVREAMTEQLLGDLRDGTLDAIIAAEPLEDPSLLSVSLFEDPFYIVAAVNTRDVIASPITQQTVDLDRLLLLDEGHCLRDQALDVCASAGPRRLVNFGATSMTTLLQLVAAGMGITLVPKMLLSTPGILPDGLSVMRFADPMPVRRVTLIYRLSTSRAADFRELAATIAETGRTMLGRTDF